MQVYGFSQKDVKRIGAAVRKAEGARDQRPQRARYPVATSAAGLKPFIMKDFRAYYRAANLAGGSSPQVGYEVFLSTLSVSSLETEISFENFHGVHTPYDDFSGGVGDADPLLTSVPSSLVWCRKIGSVYRALYVGQFQWLSAVFSNTLPADSVTGSTHNVSLWDGGPAVRAAMSCAVPDDIDEGTIVTVEFNDKTQTFHITAACCALEET